MTSRPAPRPVALVAVVAFASVACGPAPTPVPSATRLPGPTPTAVPERPDRSFSALCGQPDLLLEHGAIEGAAGSRFTTVTLTVVGQASCSIPDRPEISIHDATGDFLVGFGYSGDKAPMELRSGDVLHADLQLSSWCDPPPAQPVSLFLNLESGSIPIGGEPFPAADGMPPCNGTSGIDAIATAWTEP